MTGNKALKCYTDSCNRGKRKGEKMSSYIFETVDYDKKYPANVFVTHIGNSQFHWHYEYEICLVLKGSIKIIYDSEPTVYHENEIVLINSRVVHSVQSEEDNLCVFIQLDPVLFQENGKDTGSIRYFYLDSVRNELEPYKPYDEEFAERVAMIAYETLDDQENGYFRGRAEIYTLIADLIEYVEYVIHSNVQASENEMDLVMKFFDYIKEHLQMEEVLQNAVKELGVSQKTMLRYLKKHIGISAKEVLDIQRVTMAKHYLSETDKPVDYIIDCCGFGSEKTFYRVFKKETMMTPAEYRNKISRQRGDKKKKQGYLSFDRQETQRLLRGLLNKN